jgi:dihydrofolate reductase
MQQEKHMIISIIAAMAENRVIGRDNKMPWDLPSDRRHFHDITRGHPIILGRKTFESIGRPLSRRTNIVRRAAWIIAPKGLLSYTTCNRPLPPVPGRTKSLSAEGRGVSRDHIPGGPHLSHDYPPYCSR